MSSKYKKNFNTNYSFGPDILIIFFKTVFLLIKSLLFNSNYSIYINFVKVVHFKKNDLAFYNLKSIVKKASFYFRNTFISYISAGYSYFTSKTLLTDLFLFNLNSETSIMKTIKKEDLNQAIFDLYDAYAHNKIERRQFVEKLSVFAVGSLTVPTLLSFMMPNYKDNLLVQPNDPRIDSDYINYDSPKGGGVIKGLFSKPSNAKKKLPGVIVVHENRGLNPYIEDVGRRTAVAGFISLAPDALSPLGGYPGNDDEGREMQKKRSRTEMLEDFIAAYDYLIKHENCNGKVGVVGFCFGGWISNQMAVKLPNLAAAVPFYGGQPTEEEAAQIKTPLLLHYAGLDERVNAGWPNYEKVLKANKVEYTAHIYPDVNHGFHNNTTPRYDDSAANLAWERTLSFFRDKLL